MDQSLLKFEIQDTGIGIPPEQKSLLFKPFRQLGKSGDSKFAGSGLGMSLVKDVVALMKGTIRVESAPGAGTLVTFTARMEPCPLWRYGKRHNRSCSFCFMNADMPGWTDSLDGQLKDSSILIVEDNNVNAMLLQMMFEEVGIRQIQRTGSAEEALQMMRDGEYTFVFLDLHLPDMDGFSLVRKVHGVHEGQNPPVLIALTADTSPGIRERCQEVGMADYVAKPVELRTLRKVLMKHFLTRGQPGERNGASTRNGY
ncbi:MAG: response regulator [Spirochaetia bacterium]|nr:response regulator [Spirochaetia bacterium]